MKLFNYFIFFFIFTAFSNIYAQGELILGYKGGASPLFSIGSDHCVTSLYTILEYDEESVFFNYTLDNQNIKTDIKDLEYRLELTLSESLESYISGKQRFSPIITPENIDKNFPYVAFIQYKGIKIGRDSASWGPGNFGNLILSDASKYYDHLSITKDFGKMRFFYFFSSLNEFLTPKELLQQESTLYSQPEKYFVAHRIEYAPNKNILLALTEAEIIGGKSPGIELINPLFIFHNSYSPAVNVIAGLDLEIKDKQNRLYLSFASDDISLSENIDNDRPSAIGYLAGFESEFKKFNICAEYGRVSRYIYNREVEYQKFTNRRIITPTKGSDDYIVDYPIGYFTGPDAETFTISVKNKLIRILYQLILKGENTFYSPYYNTDNASNWFTLAGKIERKDSFLLTLNYYPFSISAKHEIINNYNHTSSDKTLNSFAVHYKLSF